MKLLVVSSWFPYPPDNGSKLRAYHLMRELSKRHAITLLSFAEPGEEKHVAGLVDICTTIRTVPGNPFKAGSLGLRGLLSPLPRSYAQTYSPAMQALVNERLPEHDAAIGLELGAALYLKRIRSVARLFDGAEVTVLREQFTSQRHTVRRLRYGFTWLKYSRFMRDLIMGFDRATVVSENEREQMIRLGCAPSRVAVLPNGVDASNLSVTGSPQPGRLIYPGSMTYSANYDAVSYFLAEVYPLIRRARPDAELAVTGSTEGVALERLPRHDGVVFTGHLPDIRTAIADSDVCVVPLRIGGGTRLKIIQSLALGTPVVSTSKGAEGLDVTPEQDILLADTPQQFARQVLRLVADRVLREKLAMAGRQWVAGRYTWDKIALHLESILSDIIQQRPTGSIRK